MQPGIAPFIRLIRPKQWLKNFFVFAPLIFAKNLFVGGLFFLACKAFVGFCLTASIIYVINDIADQDADRMHPEKRNRPLAAGILKKGHAFAMIAFLLVLDVAVVADMSLYFQVAIAGYFILNVGYSFKLKETVLLDVFVIAAGFMLRVLGGAYAVGVKVSSWLVLCSMFISLFLGFAKRRGELVQAQVTGTLAERKVLLVYRVDVIDQLLTITAAGTVISYALYSVAPRTIEIFGTEKLIYSTVFVLYGVFRYIYLVHTTPTVENPTNAVTSDLPIVVTGVCWITFCVLLIYFRDMIPVLK